MNYGNSGLDAEFVGLLGFTLADAFDFRCMQGVKLAFVLVSTAGRTPVRSWYLFFRRLDSILKPDGECTPLVFILDL